MSENKVEEFMKKHLPWFMFVFHPIRSPKKLSEEEEKIEKEMNEVMEEEKEVRNQTSLLQNQSVLTCFLC